MMEDGVTVDRDRRQHGGPLQLQLKAGSVRVGVTLTADQAAWAYASYSEEEDEPTARVRLLGVALDAAPGHRPEAGGGPAGRGRRGPGAARAQGRGRAGFMTVKWDFFRVALASLSAMAVLYAAPVVAVIVNAVLKVGRP